MSYFKIKALMVPILGVGYEIASMRYRDLMLNESKSASHPCKF